MKVRDGSLLDFSRVFVVVLLVLTALPGCGSDGSSSGSNSPQATLQSVEVTPTNASLAAGTAAQLTATAIWSNNQHTDVTSQATWTSSGPDVSVSSAGKVQATAVGSATVTALYQGQSGTATVTVTSSVLESIALTPPAATLALGTSEQLTATGTFSDGTTQNMSADVTWSSSSPNVSSISASGLVQSVAIGSSTITATCSNASVCGSISGSTGVMVTAAVLQSIQVTPGTSTVPRGLLQQFAATGIYSDGTHQDLTSSATWASDNSNVAVFNNTAGSHGHATSVNVGTAHITATSAGVVSTAVPFTVTAATLVSIAITPPAPSIALGTTQTFVATGTYTDNSTQDLTNVVVWSSSNPNVATVSNSSPAGVASAQSVGPTTIGAASGTVQASVTLTVTPAVLQSIQVTPAQPSVALGFTEQFTATGTYSDSSHQDLTSAVTWASDTPGVATISNATGSNGLAATVAPGTANITATAGSVVSSPVPLTVTPAVLVSLVVTPATPTIAAGTSQQFTATGYYTDNTSQDLTNTVTWTSSAPTIAGMSNVSPYGVAQSLQPGNTTITAAFGSVQASAILTVSAAVLRSVQVSPNSASVVLGLTQSFTATGTYTDGTTQNLTNAVTWASDKPSVVSISNVPGTNGLASSLTTGTANITATFGAIVSQQVPFTVTAAQLVSLSMAPAQNFSLLQGTTRQVTVTGVFTDGTTQDMTTSGSLTWLSSPVVLSVSNGIVTATGVGQTTLGVEDTALGIYSNTVTVTVTFYDATLFVLNFNTSTVAPFHADMLGTPSAVGQPFALPSASNSPSQVMATDPTGHFLYVLAGASIQEYQIENSGAALPGSSVADANLPSAIAVDPSGKFVYVADSQTSLLQAYAVNADGSLQTTSMSLGATGSGPAGIALTPNGAYAYVTNYNDKSVSQFTLGSNVPSTAPAPTVPTDAGPAVVVVDPAGKHVYVANYNNGSGDTISQFTIGSSGGLTPMSQPTVTTGFGPVSMAIDPSGSRLYVVNESDQTVWGYSVGANGALGTAPITHIASVATDPISIAIDPYGKYAFVVDDVQDQIIPFNINGDGTLTPRAAVATGVTGSAPSEVIATWSQQ